MVSIMSVDLRNEQEKFFFLELVRKYSEFKWGFLCNNHLVHRRLSLFMVSNRQIQLILIRSARESKCSYSAVICKLDALEIVPF